MAHFTTQTTTVVLAYTNERVRYYNEHLRKKVLPHVSVGKKFEPQEMIMFNNYYQATSANRPKEDPLHTIKYYTSYQVRLESCVEAVYDIDYKAILDTLTQEAAAGANKEAMAALRTLQSLLPNHIPIYLIAAEGNYIVRSPLHYQKVQEALEVVKTTFGSIKGYFAEDTVALFWDFYYQQMRDVFADVAYGYAMTVHKSQGSTYQRVFIDMKDIIQRNPKERESYQCLYTAITRASSEVHIYY
jgi:superfamily I DNA/RNA helicase